MYSNSKMKWLIRATMTVLVLAALATTVIVFTNLSLSQLSVQNAGFKSHSTQDKSIIGLTVPTYKVMKQQLHTGNYERVRVTATGYTAGVESTGKNPGDVGYGITYSGLPVLRDAYSTIAADPVVFPIGTILFIPGYGYGVVADTGSAIKGEIIDLYYETVEDVFEQWGKKELDVFVIKEGSGKITKEEMTHLNQQPNVQGVKRGS